MQRCRSLTPYSAVSSPSFLGIKAVFCRQQKFPQSTTLCMPKPQFAGRATWTNRPVGYRGGEESIRKGGRKYHATEGERTADRYSKTTDLWGAKLLEEQMKQKADVQQVDSDAGLIARWCWLSVHDAAQIQNQWLEGADHRLNRTSPTHRSCRQQTWRYLGHAREGRRS